LDVAEDAVMAGQLANGAFSNPYQGQITLGLTIAGTVIDLLDDD